MLTYFARFWCWLTGVQPATKPLLIFGKGGHSAVVADLAGRLGYTPVCFDDSDQDVLAGLGTSVVPACDFIVAVGDNRVRHQRHQMLVEKGYSPISLIDPTAYISAGARLGTGNIINTNSSVDHDCVLGDFVHVGPGTHLCGKVQVGSGTLLGVGSAVIPGIKIGCNSVVAAGSAVTKSWEDDGILIAGVPAKKIERRLELPPQQGAIQHLLATPENSVVGKPRENPRSLKG
jgi:acetyltransferase-like isoleucine patch superfamily enzyme